MTGILIVGAGGHASVVADILISSGQSVIGFVDDNPSLWNTQRLGLPILGSTETIPKHHPDYLANGIGDNASRLQAVTRLANDVHIPWCNAVHPTATISRFATLGRGVIAAAHTVVNPGTTIGDHVILNTGSTVDHDCRVDSFSHIAPGVHISGGVIIGQGVLVGVGATVKQLCTIGGWATIGAGAVVINHILDGEIVIGVPARPVTKTPL